MPPLRASAEVHQRDEPLVCRQSQGLLEDRLGLGAHVSRIAGTPGPSMACRPCGPQFAPRGQHPAAPAAAAPCWGLHARQAAPWATTSARPPRAQEVAQGAACRAGSPSMGPRWQGRQDVGHEARTGDRTGDTPIDGPRRPGLSWTHERPGPAILEHALRLSTDERVHLADALSARPKMGHRACRPTK